MDRTRPPARTSGEPGHREPAAAGDARAGAALVRSHLADVESYVCRRAERNEAAEVVNEVFLRALQGTRGLEGCASPLARLRAIARNVLRERRRDRRRRPASLEALAEPPAALAGGAEPWELLEHREAATAAYEALDSLAPRHRRLLSARHLEGRSTAEIAAAWGRSPQHVAVLLHRAHRALRSARLRRPATFSGDSV